MNRKLIGLTAIQDIASGQNSVEGLIMLTPTSEQRNLYTEANIHLMMAIQKLRDAEALCESPPMQFEDATALCQVPPEGWTCTRKAGHDGPCAAWPL